MAGTKPQLEKLREEGVHPDKQLNQLGQAVADADADARYDAQARNLLANKPFLAWILKYTTSEFCDMEPDDIVPYIDNNPKIASVAVVPGTADRLVSGLSQESNIPDEGKLYYDIRFFAKIPDTGAEGEFSLMIDVEMQNDPDPGYDLVSRGILYGGRMLSEQMGRNVSKKKGTGKYLYRHLQKVYSIWIVMDCSRRAANTISKYGVSHEALYGEYEDRARSDLMSVVMIRLPEEGKEENVLNKPTQLHAMLGTVFSQMLPVQDKLKRLENEFGIAVTEKIRKEVTDMCNLSQGIRNSERESANEDTARRMVKRGTYSDEEISAVADVELTRVREIREEEKTKDPVMV